jgi:hypothetical protein
MYNKFATISSVDPEKTDSWENKLFLTFDIDWAADDVINDTIKVVRKADVAATWFVTHDTPLLKEIRKNPKWELGIHPNFNFLLEGDLRNGKNSLEVIQRIMKIVPEAKSVRSHSMVQSSRLLDIFKAIGLTHDCNQFIPSGSNIRLKPWFLWNGLVRVPYSWEDDIFCLSRGNKVQPELEPIELINKTYPDSMIVFDFHPIHVFLNTENVERYEKSRTHHHSIKNLKTFQNLGIGTRSLLENLFAIK